MNDLKMLACEKEAFSTVPGYDGQLHDYDLEKNIEMLVSNFPPKIDMGPRIYGHPLQVNGNHRTGIVIDMDNRTVEYFDSFGRDSSVRSALNSFADALTKKYGGKPFKYQNRIDFSLQSDGFQCGIWVCKLIKERFRQGKNFDPHTLEKYDIAEFRAEVFNKAHQYLFFREIGISRFTNYLKQNIDQNGTKDVLIQRERKLEDKIYSLLENRFRAPGVDQEYCKIAADKLMDNIFVEWGRSSNVPKTILDLLWLTGN